MSLIKWGLVKGGGDLLRVILVIVVPGNKLSWKLNGPFYDVNDSYCEGDNGKDVYKDFHNVKYSNGELVNKAKGVKPVRVFTLTPELHELYYPLLFTII